MTDTRRNSYAWQKLSRQRRAIARANDEPCSRCGRPFQWDAHPNSAAACTTDHPDPIAYGGQLLPPIETLGVHHRRCGGHQGAAISNQRQGTGPGSRGGKGDWTPRKRSRPARPDKHATTATCEWCGCTFQPWRKTAGKYCSRECWADARTTTATWEINWQARCAICDQPMTTTTVVAEDPQQQPPSPPKHHTCSRRCSNHRSSIQAAIRSRDGYRTQTPGARTRPSKHPGTTPEASWEMTGTKTNGIPERRCRHETREEVRTNPINPLADSQPPRNPEKKSLPVIGNTDSHGWGDADLPLLHGVPPRPDSASWPRFMTAPKPGTTGTYGPQFLAWAGERAAMHPKRTTGHRWWQELVACRALEHDADGRLLWETVIMSTPRQSGKSWTLREVCLWRLGQGDRFGEVQTVVHTAPQLKHAFSVWRPAGRWAQSNGYRVRWTNGEQQIEAGDGSLWMIQAANDGLGVSLSVSLALVDEGWSVDRDLIDNALVPTMAESEQPQLWVISTAGVPKSGERITDLMPSFRRAGMPRSQSGVLFLEWSAPRSADIDDPAVWRASSAHWDERRLERMSSARAKAVEPQQVEAFRRQWLNQWPEEDSREAAWLEAPAWSGCAVEGLLVPADRAVVGVSLDEADGSWPVVLANRLPDGRIGVRLVGVFGSQRDAEAAASSAAGSGCLLLTPQHALRGHVRVERVRESLTFHEGDVQSALSLCALWVRDRRLVHDPADSGLSAAALAVPEKRVARTFGPGVLALVCAWWAGKQRPRSAVA